MFNNRLEKQTKIITSNSIMIKLANLMVGFFSGVYIAQKYKIPCIETEFYKILKDIDTRKK